MLTIGHVNILIGNVTYMCDDVMLFIIISVANFDGYL